MLFGEDMEDVIRWHYLLECRSVPVAKATGRFATCGVILYQDGIAFVWHYWV